MMSSNVQRSSIGRYHAQPPGTPSLALHFGDRAYFAITHQVLLMSTREEPGRPVGDGMDSQRVSDILSAYGTAPPVPESAPNSAGMSLPPSYEKDIDEDLPGIQPAPPLAIDHTNGLPATGVVATDAIPQPERRIRWDANMNASHPRGGPTVTVRRTATQTANSRSGTGIKRQNHPGQISLAGLQPTIAPESTRQATDPNATNVIDLDEGEDEDDFLANIAGELGEFDEEGDHTQTIASDNERAVIDPEAFGHGQPTPSSEGGTEYIGLGSGAPLTPGETASDGSYDPFRDADFEHLNVIPGETDGMPVTRRRRRSWARLRSNESNWTKIRRALGIDSINVPLDDAAEKGVLGKEATNLKDIPVQTSSGLRSGRRSRPSRYERKASQLVRAHKLLGVGRDPVAEAKEIPDLDRSHLPGSEATTPDALESADVIDPRPVPSGGVLGQLLKLYDTDVPQGSEVTSLPSSTPGTAPVPTDSMGNSYNDHQSEAGRLLGVTDGTVVSPGSNRGSSRPQSFHGGRPQSMYHSATNQAATIGNAGGRVIKGVVNETGIDIDERPKAARSSAGVFGALVATTGNLIGAVSPNHAQLGANPKRPGYTLDRYVLPEMNEKTLRRTAKIVSDRGAPVSREQAMSRRSMDTTVDSLTGDKKGTMTDISATPVKSGKRLNKLRNIPGIHTPDILSSKRGEYFDNSDSRAKSEWAKKLKKRRKQRHQQEIFITMHVAAILQRQEFLLKLSRCLMMFGAPTHRIETQIQQTATVLEINCRCVYFPNLMLLSFGDDATHTSETKIIKQASVLDLTKLTDMHTVYWNVIHDKIGVEVASKQLDALMLRKPFIRKLPLVIVGGLASGLICFGESGFAGSFLDAIVAGVLGAFLVFCQLTITTELYSNIFEIVFATLNSFVALAMHSIPSRIFCYKPIVSASIVLILPGFIVLSGALELQSKNIVSGSVRLVYAIIYSVLLGFGISIGSLPASAIDSKELDAYGDVGCRMQQRMLDCDCGRGRPNHWFTTVGSGWFGFLTVPGYAAMLSLRNQAKFNRKEFPSMILIACTGWITSHVHVLLGKRRKDVWHALQEPYMTAAMGSFTVGILANIYGRMFDGRSFVVAVPGILYQLPTGLNTVGQQGSNGILNNAGKNITQNNTDNSTNLGSDAVTNGFAIGTQLLSVALGITIGIFISTLIMHILGGRKVRGGGLFSF